MRHLTGVKALLFKKANIVKLPTKAGLCEIDLVDGQIRWFVAVKLPRPIYLCDPCYLEIREELEKTLSKVFQGG